MGQVSMGVQKKVMGGNGTIRLNVSDIFLTNYFRGDFNTPTVTTQVINYNENRVVRVGFTYRFGSNKIAQARQRQTGLEAEKGRVKNQ